MKREVILEPEAQAVPGGPLPGCDGTVYSAGQQWMFPRNELSERIGRFYKLRKSL